MLRRSSFRLAPETRLRRVVWAAVIYLACTLVFAVVAGPQRLMQHSPFNHYALLADAWLHGHQDIAGGPPAYSMGEDFAHYNGKTYISFPPFPAVLMLPLVKLAGSPENFYDVQFIVELAGIGPALLFLVLEKLRRDGRSSRTEKENAGLALLFAFGTVYFFTAVQGSVWYAAHVVGVGLGAAYLLTAIGATHPLLAGLFLASAWLTRPTMLLLFPLFALEAIRISHDGSPVDGNTMLERLRSVVKHLDRRALVKRCAPFVVPIVGALLLASWMNHARYGNWNPSDFGHEYLSIRWQGRIMRWGLFGSHYLSKNLGCMLTILPWLPPKGGHAAGTPLFQINEHGLALWFTTPLYFWLLWPKKKQAFYGVVALSVSLPILMNLLYQNTGWLQFGYRFSNDYALLLFVLLAIGERPTNKFFALAAMWGLAWNLFGAISFARPQFNGYYYADGTQTVLYQPD